MSHQSSLIESDILAYLEQHENKEILRFLTCGSVDDGKSTLIGRLLHDSQMLYEDQIDALRRDSARDGTQGDQIDLALLVDGLQAEREQGITIDVAYRYFSTTRRKFIIADTPGHEQYTRNMVTGASTCDVAVILIDARQGMLVQTRRHSFIASLLGIRHLVVAINKMDLVGWSEDVFNRIMADYRAFATHLQVEDLRFIPLSALTGDNVVDPSGQMPWYQGSTLLHMLENIHIASDRNLADLRFPVQRVNRPNSDFRGYSGTVESGVVRPGDAVMALPSRRRTTVESIVTMDGTLERAFAPMAVTLTLADEIDLSRGDMLVHPDSVPRVQDRFEAHVVWMSDQPLRPGHPYLIKHTTRQVSGRISRIAHGIDVNTMEHHPVEVLGLNAIGRCEVALAQPVAFDPYVRNRGTGAFIVIDRISNITVGAGMIIAPAESGGRDVWQQSAADGLVPTRAAVQPDERESRFAQRPATLLLTGLTGSGKTSIAKALERRLFDAGHLAMVLDGQDLRLGLSRDLSFSAEDRSENLRRAIDVARIVNSHGLIAIISVVAPHAAARQQAAESVGSDRFVEVHLDCDAATCRERSDSGLWEAADAGEVGSFPGVSSVYEAPAAPALALNTASLSIDACVDRIVALLRSRDLIG